jgi:hypothetical protein
MSRFVPIRLISSFSLGHQDPSVERVFASNDRFLIVEKQGAAARDADETDPRS